jgi:hypothetical protein
MRGAGGVHGRLGQDHESALRMSRRKVCGEHDCKRYRTAKAETSHQPKDFQLQRRVDQCRQQRKNAKRQYTADEQGPASQPVTQQTRAEQAEQQSDIASR